jgi:hypothetical protein
MSAYKLDSSERVKTSIVGRVNALDSKHRGQTLCLADCIRVASEQRFDKEWAFGLDDEMYKCAGMSTRGTLSLLLLPAR